MTKHTPIITKQLQLIAPFTFLLLLLLFRSFIQTQTLSVPKAALSCAQLPAITPIHPPIQINPSTAVTHLSRAIQIPTESYDDKIVPKPFLDFHAFLQETYPLIHKHLTRTVVANYSLLFTWPGKFPEKESLVLMSHMDVVPVLPDTLGDWTFPPYEGRVQDGRVWGRGGGDTKSTLIGIMEAVEGLLAVGFVPERTVYLAFGHDEEAEGKGGFAISQHMEQNLGLTGKVGLIIDEGSGLLEMSGVTLASVGVSEKGYIDVELIVETKGGHSSVPPKHSGIGYSALLINALESSPFTPELPIDHPIVSSMTCFVEHAPNPPLPLVNAIRNWPHSRPDLLALLVQFLPPDVVTSMLETTQAVDVIHGGLKVNALPEKVTTLVNHRIGAHDSLKGVQDRVISLLAPVSRKLGLNVTLEGFVQGSSDINVVEMANAVGRVTIKPLSKSAVLEPSPISPYNTDGDRGWRVLEGTIHNVFDQYGVEGRVVVSPLFMGGNTDTKSYWNLSKSIYRFSPGWSGDDNIHTVDEWTDIKGYLKGIHFYSEVIQNWSEA